MSNIVLVMGYPGSGKSTLTKDYAKEGYISLNRDTIGGTIAALVPKMKDLIKDNKNVVLDNLFPTRDVRKPFIDAAKALGADIRAVVMSTTIEEAQFNVVQRAIGLLGKFPSPEEIKKAKHTNIFPPLVLFKYKKEYEAPSLEEGFSNVEIFKFKRNEDSSFVNKAIILDYDGTLRECINGNDKYPVSEDQIAIKAGRNKVLKKYQAQGYMLLGVSNQSGIQKGLLAHDKAVELFDYTNKQLGLNIEYSFCPHQSAPISCYCRKPMSGLGVEFIIKHKLNRKQCIMVGDFTTDKTFATRCGFQYIDQKDFFQ